MKQINLWHCLLCLVTKGMDTTPARTIAAKPDADPLFESPLLSCHLPALEPLVRVQLFNYFAFHRAPILSYFLGFQGDALWSVAAACPQFQLSHQVQLGNSWFSFTCIISAMLSFLLQRNWHQRHCFSGKDLQKPQLTVGALVTHRLLLQHIIYQ